MTVYIILLVLNLLGMAYLFYSREQQGVLNTEYLKNILIVSAALDFLKKETEDLTDQIAKLKTELDELKKQRL